MRLRWTVLTSIVVSTLVGAAVGFVLGQIEESRSQIRSFAGFVGASYVDDALRADRDVGYLNLLRAGNTDAAIVALEHDLDGTLESLATYHEYVPHEQRRKAVYELIARIRPYRETHPSDLPPGAKRNALEKGLALSPSSSPGRQ